MNVRSNAESEPIRVVVLASGRGTNLQAIIDAEKAGVLLINLVGVIYNRAGAECATRAGRAGIPTYLLVSRGLDRESYGGILLEKLLELAPDLIVTAGFNRILGTQVIAAFADRIINIHPSLLPAFAGGLHAQADALAYGVKVTGCTVHFVNNEVDAGPIIRQAAVPVRKDDNEASLSARILEQEHLILVEAIELYAHGRLRVEGRRVRILDLD